MSEFRVRIILRGIPSYQLGPHHMQVFMQPGTAMPPGSGGLDSSLKCGRVNVHWPSPTKAVEAFDSREYLSTALIDELHGLVFGDILQGRSIDQFSAPRARTLILPCTIFRGRAAGDTAEEPIVEIFVVAKLQPVIHRLLVDGVIRQTTQQFRPAHLRQALGAELLDKEFSLRFDDVRVKYQARIRQNCCEVFVYYFLRIDEEIRISRTRLRTPTPRGIASGRHP